MTQETVRFHFINGISLDPLEVTPEKLAEIEDKVTNGRGMIVIDIPKGNLLHIAARSVSHYYVDRVE